MKYYSVDIEILRDSTTGRLGLGFVDKDGSGERISNGKDTGQWTSVNVLNCNFSQKTLNQYAQKEGAE